MGLSRFQSARKRFHARFDRIGDGDGVFKVIDFKYFFDITVQAAQNNPAAVLTDRLYGT